MPTHLHYCYMKLIYISHFLFPVLPSSPPNLVYPLESMYNGHHQRVSLQIAFYPDLEIYHPSFIFTGHRFWNSLPSSSGSIFTEGVQRLTTLVTNISYLLMNNQRWVMNSNPSCRRRLHPKTWNTRSSHFWFQIHHYKTVMMNKHVRHCPDTQYHVKVWYLGLIILYNCKPPYKILLS